MAKKKAKQQTTRDKYAIENFNFHKNGVETITTLANYTASKDNKFKNIKLYGAEDGMSVDGQTIITHAGKNVTMKELGYDNVTVKTDGINSDTNYRIYGAPFKTVLNNRQHYNNCGIESTLNTLAMAGKIKMKENLSDQKSVEKNFLKQAWTLNLCQDSGVIGKLDEADGGTLVDDYKDIFRLYDIDAESYYMNTKCYYNEGTQFSDINELAYKISQGHGAVIGVCSGNLWQEQKSETDETKIDHAIAITGVVYKDNTDPSELDEDGNYKNPPVGFYIHDSGAWMSRYISLDEFKAVTLFDQHGMSSYDDYLAGEYVDYDPQSGDTPMTEEEFEEAYKEADYNEELRTFDPETREYIGKKKGIFVTITSDPIKNEMFNLNATGDKQDNNIWGNSGDNIIKGMDGHDTLYGNAGDDEIRGGKGNDVIIGNNISSDIKNWLNNTYSFGLGNIDAPEADKYKYLTGMNKLYGDAGNDTIIGGDDIDLIYGGAGNDKIYTGDGRNAAYGGKGNDVIVGGWENDRLFGDAGNDVIYGWGDDDTIHGGDGNDKIYGGSGNDVIETGKGNDIVYFEGTEHGTDMVSSQGGSTTFQFIDEKIGDDTYSVGAKISDMYFGLERNEDNSKIMDLGIAYTPDMDNAKDGIAFNSFFNNKKNKAKALTLFIGEGDDAEKYNVSATNKKSADISKSTVNNVLFTTYTKGTTISTGANNDIVTMVGTEDPYNRLSDSESIIDTIIYTGGNDRYVSEERNTRYCVQGFGNTTSLSIYDNVDALEKYQSDASGLPVIDPTTQKPKTDKVVSEHDELYVNIAQQSDLHFFFDVGVNDNKAYTTVNDGLYILNNTNYKYIVTGDATGVISMNSFFGYDFDTKTAKEFTDTGFFGNGRIETVYYGEGTNYADYAAISDLTNDLTKIASQVAGWLSSESNQTGETTAFEAFENAGTTDISGLIQAYTVN